MKTVEKTDKGVIIQLAHYTSSGRDWVAEIEDTDPQFGFERVFLEPGKDWSSSGKTGWSYYELRNGNVYEVNEPYKGRWFFQVVNGECLEISKEDVLEYLEQKKAAVNNVEELMPVTFSEQDEVYEENDKGVLQRKQPTKFENGKAVYLISSNKTYAVVSPKEKGVWSVCLYLGGAARFAPKCVNVETKPQLESQRVKDVVNAYDAISK